MSSPELFERNCGGWLAKSGSADSIKIGVLADTRFAAEAAFAESMARWEAAFLSQPDAASIHTSDQT